MKQLFFLAFTATMAFMSCNSDTTPEEKSKYDVQIVTLDPGHFHAALVQKTMYKEVDSVVNVYAPEGNDLKLHLDRINGFNTRKDDPTHWKEELHTGNDYFEKMLSDKKGNVVVLSGNNRKKTEYILKSLEAGFNVLADKPMVINGEGFETLKKAFETAKEKNLTLYDIMTERFEITTILQRELSMIPEIFGKLDTGTVDDPAVIMTSDHNFYKNVSGNVVVRPAWFMDASQQGNGIVDVTTHLVDLVQWECFPEQTLDYTKDIMVTSAKRWPTDMTMTQFKTITKLNEIPSFIESDKQNDTLLKVWSNGEINYKLKGVHAKVIVVWKYQTESGNDAHYSSMRGSKVYLNIKQGKEQQYKPTLYIEPFDISLNTDTSFEKLLTEKMKIIQAKYPGVELKKTTSVRAGLMVLSRWEVIIPDKYKEGHESHFARVTENYLNYFKNHNMPAWEVPNMLAKYYTTTKGLELALKNN
jgi:predicted dehydrogenase